MYPNKKCLTSYPSGNYLIYLTIYYLLIKFFENCLYMSKSLISFYKSISESWIPFDAFRCSYIIYRCTTHLCNNWSNSFYCNSRHEICVLVCYYNWLLVHGLPSGDKQLNLFVI